MGRVGKRTYVYAGKRLRNHYKLLEVRHILWHNGFRCGYRTGYGTTVRSDDVYPERLEDVTCISCLRFEAMKTKQGPEIKEALLKRIEEIKKERMK